MADVLVAVHWHALARAVHNVAVGEFSRENTAWDDDKGALETAGGSDNGVGGLQGARAMAVRGGMRGDDG